MIVLRNRASIVLYDFLSIHKSKKPFILPVNICPVVPLIFLLRNVPFELVDIDSKTLCLNEEVVIEKIRSRPSTYGGVLFNHSYGTSYSPEAFFRELKCINNEILIIDDKCLCEPQLEPEIPSTRDLILFSTGYSKVADIGYGGYGFVNKELEPYFTNSNLKNKAGADLDKLSNTYKISLIEDNNFFSQEHPDISIPFLNITWEQYHDKICNSLTSIEQHRKTITNIYKDNLDWNICLDDKFQGWRFNIITSEKNKILTEIFSNNLFASSHYQPLTKKANQHLYPNAFELYDKIVNLFIDKHYTPAAAEKTVTIINSILNS